MRATGEVRPWIIALGALALGVLALRIAHVNGTLPYVHHWDEPRIAGDAAHMLVTGTATPREMKYPSLPKYAAAAAIYLGYAYESGDFSLEHIEELGNVIPPYYDRPDVMKWPRYLFVLVSVATLVATGFAAWQVTARPSALVAAPLLVATSPDVLSRAVDYLNTDNIGTCFVVAAGMVLLHGMRERSPTFLATVPGALAGLAAACKYTQGLVLVPVLLAITLHANRPARLSAGACLVAGAAFVIAAPHSVLDFPGLLKVLAYHARVYGVNPYGWTEAEPGLGQGVAYARHFAEQLGTGATLLAAVGLAAFGARDWRAATVIAAFPAALIAPFIVQHAVVPRNLLPVIPFVAMLAIAGLYATGGWIREHIGRRSAVGAGAAKAALWATLIAACFGGAIDNAYRHQLDISSDSRHEGVAWLKANVSTSTTIVTAKLLGLDPRTLERQGYSVTEMELAKLDDAGALARALDSIEGDVAALIPKWGVREQREEDAARARRLNAAAAELVASAAFGHRTVKIDRKYPVSSPWPQYAIVVLKRADGR